MAYFTGKKTIPLWQIKGEINRIISLENLSDEKREPLCLLLESILMDTKQYRGFSYLDWEKENNRVKPGCEYRRNYF